MLSLEIENDRRDVKICPKIEEKTSFKLIFQRLTKTEVDPDLRDEIENDRSSHKNDRMRLV